MQSSVGSCRCVLFLANAHGRGREEGQLADRSPSRRGFINRPGNSLQVQLLGLWKPKRNQTAGGPRQWSVWANALTLFSSHSSKPAFWKKHPLVTCSGLTSSAAGGQQFHQKCQRSLASHYGAIGDTISCDAPYSAIGFRGKLFLRYPLVRPVSLACNRPSLRKEVGV